MFDPFSLTAALQRPRLLFTEAGGDGGGDGSGGDGAGGEGGSTYTPPASQADLDRIIEGRLARERKNYEGYDDFKAKAAKWDELEDGKKTPDQKAIDEATERAKNETTQHFLQRIVTTEVKSIATSLGFNDATDALQVLGTDLPVKDDEPDTDEIKKRVEKLAADKPYLVANGSRRREEPRRERKGEPVDGSGDSKSGKSKAAAALRQLGAARRGS